MTKEDYFKYYIQGSDHYLIPKDIFDELFDEMVNWKEESKELKKEYLNAVVDYEITMSDKTELEKQLEEKENIACNWKDSCLENAGKIEKLENQQKEFINYLEDEIKRINPKNLYISELNLRLDDIKFTQYLIYKEVLQKYKEIIGE